MVFRMKKCCQTASGSSEGHNSEVQHVRFAFNVLLTHFGSILHNRKKPTLHVRYLTQVMLKIQQTYGGISF